MVRAQFYSSIAQVDASLWNGLFNCDNPFIQHAFLLALEESGCVSAATGWQPQHLVLYQRDQAIAAMPLYIKSHSHGEFVFDWGWVEAYERHGLAYYPKLLTAVPFTPSAGPRAGFAPGQDQGALASALLARLKQHAQRHNCSSWHLLFAEDSLGKQFAHIHQGQLLHRQDVQFHWFNRDYQRFDDFLLALRSSRRKSLKRDRRLVAEQGVKLQRKTGEQISDEDWSGFYRCYRRTYLKRSGHPGYLTRGFFVRLLEKMRDQLMLVVAERDGAMIASSLFLFDSHTLYGRYWGALSEVNCLHFEACFYQGIEFCIEKQIVEFDPGTQGEHKLLRGFEPFITSSYHWISDPRFRDAIGDFLKMEKKGVQSYGERVAEFLPFKRGS